MFFDREAIARLKETPITHYLQSVGIKPVRSSGNELVYCSPLTGERTPSFYVNPSKNRFNCFSSGENGDVIHLVCLLEKKPFKLAIERLATIDPETINDFSFSSQLTASTKPLNTKKSALTLVDVRVLQNPVLIEYVVSRGIPAKLAEKYLHEVRYENCNREYYAVGFETDKGSYALRSKAFKGWLGQSEIRTVHIEGSTTINLFEGYFDFLSALTYYKRMKPSFTTVVLNSTANLKQALETLEVAKSINCYLDNDTSGRATLLRLEKLGSPVKDCSTIYHNYKDFNEMLQKNYK
jgi:DNA primase